MKTPSTTVMQDFVFGTLDADDTTLAVERNRWSGIRHLFAIEPLDPLPDQPVTLTVTVGRETLIDRLTAYVTTDGSEPAGNRGIAANGFAVALARAETIWQPLYWDYAEVWRGQIPGQPEGTYVRYVIEGWHSQNAGVSHRSREMNIDRTSERPALYGYSVDRFQAPAWAHEAIVYQIFVDRFAPALQRWLEPGEMNEFVGGSLRGVINHLDYIAGLGANAIWLTPIFTCDDYHGYGTIDYMEIDPRFGSKADLHELVGKAHDRGLRVILDFVANHISVQAPIFQEARANADSPHRSWFSFGPQFQHGYRTFFTAASMPQLDLDDPGARDFLLAAARYWLSEFDIDGYRLDYAAGPSHDFWSAFGAACKGVNPDCWLFGEVTLGSDWLRSYTGRLDGCLDFSFTRQVRRLCADPNADGKTLADIVVAIERTWRYFPPGFTHPCFIDNHDMNRFLWTAGNDKLRLRMAAGLLYAFGGSPILYYGTEVGLSQPAGKGPRREEARQPMLWGEAQDPHLLAHFRHLIAFRRQHPALAYGQVHTLFLDEKPGLWLAERTHKQDRVLVAVNAGAESATLTLPDGVFQDQEGGAVQGALTLAPLSCVLVAG